MSFTESNTVEAYVRDLLAGPIKAVPANNRSGTSSQLRTESPKASAGATPPLLRCRARFQETLVEPWLRDALIRLNPEIASQPDRADEVLYKLRAPSCCRYARMA